MRSHPGRFILHETLPLKVNRDQIAIFDPGNLAIPSCSQMDWRIAMSILASEAVRMGAVASLSEGEVHALTHKAFIGMSIDGPIILRGASLTLYAVREASQGEELHLDVPGYLRGKSRATRAYAHLSRRVGIQRSAPQNNFRRVIAAIVEPGAFCFDTVKYITEASTHIDLDLLIAILNSKLIDWYFRLASTNSKVNEYQFDLLPFPAMVKGGAVAWQPLVNCGEWDRVTNLLMTTCTRAGTMPLSVTEAISEMSRRIQAIESRRVLKNRSERSHLAPESQPIQDAIDAILFRCYGLSEEEGKYITHRLGEML